jgi:hypothetical protein
MVEFVYEEEAIVAALSSSIGNAPAAFSLACAIRIVNSAKTIRVPSDVIAKVLEAKDEVSAIVLGRVGPRTNTLENHILSLIPDEEDDSSIQGSLVDDACSGLVYTLRSLGAESARNAAWAARRAYDLVDRYASLLLNESSYSAEGEESILRHPLVQQELRRQRRDLGDVIVDSSGVSNIVVGRAAYEEVLEKS